MGMLKSTTPTIKKQEDGSFLLTTVAPFICEQGGTIKPLELIYETFGTLSEQKDNVVLIHHALSTGPHLCSSAKNPEPGWWEAIVGPGKVVDTNRFFVICINNIGSCFGSSGPTSMNPETHKPYQADFPEVTLADMAKSHEIVLSALGIDQLYAVIGNSMGGMISLAFARLFSNKVQRLILVSSCYKAYPMNIALHRIQQQIIQLDPGWKAGHYDQQPIAGLKISRKLGYLHYRSHEELNARFQETEALESYLDYNAQKHAENFDANTYLYLTNAMDSFDATKMQEGSLDAVTAKTLVISVDSDVLFEPFQQQALADLLKASGTPTTLINHQSDRGHDAFYNDPTIGHYIQQHLKM